MIEIGENKWRTLDQPIYLGDGRQVYRVFANDKQVYPENKSNYMVKCRGRRTIHASHSHDGRLANALYGPGPIARIYDVAEEIYGYIPPDVHTSVDYFFPCNSVSFDISVSFSAVLRGRTLSVRTSSNAKTTDFTNYRRHNGFCEIQNIGGHNYTFIEEYIENGKWGEEYGSIINPEIYHKTCCPLYGTTPIACPNVILTHFYPAWWSEESIIDADILVSIQMSTPYACGPIAAGYVEYGYDFGNETWGSACLEHMSYPEISANNGIHRVHAIVNSVPGHKYSEYPTPEQQFRLREDCKPHYNSQPAIGNGYVTCGFPTYSNPDNPGGDTDIATRIPYLRVSGVTMNKNLNVSIPEYRSFPSYNFTDNWKNYTYGEHYLNGATLCEVPIDEFLYVGEYDFAPEEHKEPRMSDLEW